MEETQTNELEQKLSECEKKCEEYLAGWKRAQADFVNYKKEQEKMRAEVVEFAHVAIASRLLEVVDQFDESLKHKKADDEWTKGIEAIRTNLQKLLDEEGVKRMEVVGKPFNPELHEAVGEVPILSPTLSEEQNRGSSISHPRQDVGGEIGTGIVAEEVRAGYMIKDRVLRPARVVVGK